MRVDCADADTPPRHLHAIEGGGQTRGRVDLQVVIGSDPVRIVVVSHSNVMQAEADADVWRVMCPDLRLLRIVPGSGGAALDDWVGHRFGL